MDAMSEKRGIVIHFMDGSTKTLEFPKQAPDDQTTAHRLKEALAARSLVIEAEGALIVIPFENVKYLQSYPAPAKLPDYAIRGATFKG
jgi:hypothetical protein